MVVITKDYFSIRQICESGQCFRLEKLGEEGVDRYGLTALGRYLEIGQTQNEIQFDCPEEEFKQVWRSYFDLDEDYGKIMGLIDERDAYLLEAAAFGRGIRILRQDLWEIIISFIISQQNNIKRIRKCIGLLCQKYGEKKVTERGISYYDFPSPQVLALASLEDLYACNLGYRSRYIRETALSVLRGEVDLARVSTMDYQAAKEELMKLCGVGTKVAECICLFALHQTDAFPIDTHINKVLARQYPDGFPFGRYKGYAGTIQQYIFYYDLKNF
ncbi:MAG: 8-oxoguanine DNA glycosylase [Lachnospiraceae bacterium]|nr:8-oxoguanine DNA glycosylase [Lachnospiraceae bacterium]